MKDEDGAIQPNEGRMLTLAGLFDIWKPPPEVLEEYLKLIAILEKELLIMDCLLNR